MLKSLREMMFTRIRLGTETGPTITSGTGSPEGVVTAPVGSIYHRTDGAAGTVQYNKESGTGNTGWVAYGGSSGGLTRAAASALALWGI